MNRVHCVLSKKESSVDPLGQLTAASLLLNQNSAHGAYKNKLAGDGKQLLVDRWKKVHAKLSHSLTVLKYKSKCKEGSY